MMLRKGLFALSSVLLLGATAACGDDDPENGDGNGNGEVECSDEANADHPDCKEPPKLEGCDDPANADKPECSREDAREELVHSYVNSLSLPEKVDGELTCCWDYNAENNKDPEGYDNALVSVLGALGSFLDGVDVGQLLGDLLQDGDLTLLFEFKDLPEPLEFGAFDLSLYLGEIDPASTVSAADRLAGQGEFFLGDKLATINNASLRRGILSANADELVLTVDITGFLGEDDDLGLPPEISLPLNEVRLQFEPSEGDNGLEASATSADGKSINFLSGVLVGDSVAALLNDILGDMCSLSGDLLSFSAEVSDVPQSDMDDLEPGELASPKLTVNDAMITELENGNATCQEIAGFAGVIGVVGGLFDIDVTGNRVADGLSLGLNLGMTGATIVEEEATP